VRFESEDIFLGKGQESERTETEYRSSEWQEQAGGCLIYRQREAVECLVLGQAGYGMQADLIGKERR
jgi:hypothetical protein